MECFLRMDFFARECSLQENTSGTCCYPLGLGEKTPDHSNLGDCRKRDDLRERLDTENLMTVLNRVGEELKSMGLMRQVFTFVAASHLGESAKHLGR